MVCLHSVLSDCTGSLMDLLLDLDDQVKGMLMVCVRMITCFMVLQISAVYCDLVFQLSGLVLIMCSGDILIQTDVSGVSKAS